MRFILLLAFIWLCLPSLSIGQCTFLTSANGNSISSAFANSLSQSCTDTTIQIDSQFNLNQGDVLTGSNGKLRITSNGLNLIMIPQLNLTSFSSVQLNLVRSYWMYVVNVGEMEMYNSTLDTFSFLGVNRFYAFGCSFPNVDSGITREIQGANLYFTLPSQVDIYHSRFFKGGSAFRPSIDGPINLNLYSCQITSTSTFANSITISNCVYEDYHAVLASQMVVSDSIFKNNYLPGTSSIASLFFTGSGRAIIRNSLFLNNTGVGSVIQISNGQLLMDNCNLINNVSPFAITASDLVNITSSNFRGNLGGIILSSNGIILKNVTMEDNNRNSVFQANGASIRGTSIRVSDSSFRRSTGGVFINGDTASQSSGAINITNCLFDSNKGTDGTVVNGGSGFVAVSNSVFSNNYALESGGCIYGVKNTIYNCTFMGNRAEFDGGVIRTLNNFGTYYTNISLSSFYNNSSPQGGAVYSIIGLSIVDCDFSSNSADRVGGAVFSDNFEVRRTLFSFNRATSAGGGIYSSSPTKLFLISINATGNRAGSGGFLYVSTTNNPVNLSFRNSIMSLNLAEQGSGGSIWLGDSFSNLTLSDLTFDSNLATLDGGALSINPTAISLNSSISQITSRFNHAGNSGGFLSMGTSFSNLFFDQIRSEGDSATINGGAISILSAKSSANIFITNSMFHNSLSSSIGGSLYFAGLLDTLSLEENQFMNNTCETYSGGAIAVGVTANTLLVRNSAMQGNSAAFQGGAISLQSSSKINSVMLENIIAVNNSAQYGFAFSFSSQVSELVMKNNILSSNSGFQGGLYLSGSSGSVFIFNNTFYQNSATFSGSAVSLSLRSENVSLSNCNVVQNYSPNDGGALTAQDGSLLNFAISNSLFDGNNGGSLRIDQDNAIDITISGSRFQNNVGNEGSAIFVTSSSKVIGAGNVQIVDSEFDANSASNGGAISFQLPLGTKRDETKLPRISNSKFNNNSAKQYGGAINVQGGLSLDTSQFQSNSANINGNSVSVEKGYVILSGNTLSGAQLYLKDSSSYIESQDNGVDSLINCGEGRGINKEGQTFTCKSVPPSNSLSSDTKLIIGIAVGVGGFLILLLVALIVAFLLFYKRVSKGENSLGMQSMVKDMMLEDVQVGSVIGKGYFGCVYSGVWNGLAVAIKTIVEDDNEDASKKWKEEIKLLRKLNHPNIVRLFGLCHVEKKLSMVLEYAENGALDSFLRRTENADSLSNNDLIIMSYEVAQGMSYLAKRGVIHRDLAARNLLLDGQRHVKISDFGMSREDSFYEAKTKVIPYRWCAPEVIRSGSNSSLSDVWSFGVCIWEIFSLGAVPYGMVSNEQVVQMVNEGQRLEQPVRCPNLVFAIIKMCWAAEAKHRPSFSQICTSFLEHYPSLLKKVVHDMDDQTDTGTYFMQNTSDPSTDSIPPSSDIYNSP